MVSGGIKSLYDAHRSLWTRFKSKHKSLKREFDVDFEDAELGIYAGSTVVVVTVSQGRKVMDGIIQENNTTQSCWQQADVDISEVITSMWAHEEDAGVQMLGCVVPTVVGDTENEDGVLRISLSAVAAVVNAMKAHPNEVIVQEKACHALQLMASSDGKRSVFRCVRCRCGHCGTMQAHVSDAGCRKKLMGSGQDYPLRRRSRHHCSQWFDGHC
jgi:hypothetical protein